jgi:hypothetical protein
LSTWVEVAISVSSGLVGTLLGAWATVKSAVRLRRSEVRFDGYVAIQRFLTSTLDQADFDMENFAKDRNSIRPTADQVGPEAQAIANFVASKEVLEAVGAYISSLKNFYIETDALKDIGLQITNGPMTQDLVKQRKKHLLERSIQHASLTEHFRSTNKAMRKDLDLDEVDWAELESAQKNRNK